MFPQHVGIEGLWNALCFMLSFHCSVRLWGNEQGEQPCHGGVAICGQMLSTLACTAVCDVPVDSLVEGPRHVACCAGVGGGRVSSPSAVRKGIWPLTSGVSPSDSPTFLTQCDLGIRCNKKISWGGHWNKLGIVWCVLHPHWNVWSRTKTATNASATVRCER